MGYWRNYTPLSPRKLTYETPEALWNACIAYFEYVDNHPLYEDKIGWFEGFATHEKVAKKRPYTQTGLKVFLGVGEKFFRTYRSKPEFEEVCEMIDSVIYTQKFEGAASGFFNSQIMARDLGLVDKQEIATEHSVNTDQAAQFSDMLMRLADRIDNAE